jgi:deoxyadenosine/deoxycytidine kinase
MPYSYIAIEGNIGAGKTSLATILANDLKADLILEAFSENVFLEKFYKDPEHYAFPVEVSFLKDRFVQLKQYFDSRNKDITIADYSFDKCFVFASVNLPEDELDLFRELYKILAGQLLRPDIILYLHNQTIDLQQNIIKRGRSYELDIEEYYLYKIQDRYYEYFLTIQDIPVLWVDVCGEDFVDDYTKY